MRKAVEKYEEHEDEKRAKLSPDFRVSNLHAKKRSMASSKTLPNRKSIGSN